MVAIANMTEEQHNYAGFADGLIGKKYTPAK